MTPEVIAAIALAGTSLITALVTGIVTIMAQRTTKNVVVAKLQEVASKADEIATKADVIKGHVNSAATESKTTIAGLERELALMRIMLTNKDETAARLAQAVTMAPIQLAPVGDGVGTARAEGRAEGVEQERIRRAAIEVAAGTLLPHPTTPTADQK